MGRKSLTEGHHQGHEPRKPPRGGRAWPEIGNGWRATVRAAHHARDAVGVSRPRNGGSDDVETVVGIALIVIAALEIWFIVRTVQANMGRP
jgi:hypothetical protein